MKQSSNRNISVDRERISNACIIGLYNLLGNSISVKLPSKRAKNTLAHLSINETQINNKNVTEIVQEMYNFPVTLDKNKRRDKEVAIFNTVSKEVIGNRFKLAKRTTAVKTLKLKIFKEIAIFNKNGVIQFGSKVTHSIMNRNPFGKCSQKAFIDLMPCDHEILQIFREVCSHKENIIENYMMDYPSLMKLMKNENEDNDSLFSLNSTYCSNSFVKSEEYWRNEYGRGVFKAVDTSLYQTVVADWFMY